MTDQQLFLLVVAVLGADVSVASILFGVMGFLYSVFATFARRDLASLREVNEDDLDLRPHPILAPLNRAAKWILYGLGCSLLIAISCLIWFFFQSKLFAILLLAGIIVEVTLLFGIGAWIAFKLMYVSK